MNRDKIRTGLENLARELEEMATRDMLRAIELLSDPADDRDEDDREEVEYLVAEALANVHRANGTRCASHDVCEGEIEGIDDAGPAPGPPKGLSPVPRGHCGRCDRCGWPFAQPGDYGCRPGDCSQRPALPLRESCIGCGAPFEPPPAVLT